MNTEEINIQEIDLQEIKRFPSSSFKVEFDLFLILKERQIELSRLYKKLIPLTVIGNEVIKIGLMHPEDSNLEKDIDLVENKKMEV